MIERRETNGLTLLLFPPGYLSLYVDSLGGDRARPHNYSEALARTGADAVLDGPMFDICDSSPGQTYATANCGLINFRHLDVLSGINVPSDYPSRGMTISILNDGSAVAADGDDVAQDARVAVQLYPTIVRNGRPFLFSAQANASRAALAIMQDGRLAFVASGPMSLDEFSARLVAAGAKDAGYTDGGGSTSLATPDRYAGSSEHRRVVSWLLAKAQPSVVVPIAVVLLGLGAWFWWSKRNK